MLTACSISLRVEPGQLIAIVGSVGSGKSSLLECLLGEMDKLSGTIVMQVSAMFSKTAVAPALSSRDFVARVRDFIARQSRRRCAVELHAATLSLKQTRLLHQFSRFTILLHKHGSKTMKLFHI